MQSNQEYESRIDVKDLFFHVLCHWRGICVAALIGALFLGLFQFFSIESVHRKGERTKEERQFEIDLQSYRTSMETYQSDIETYTKLIEARKSYQNNSILMQLDPQKVWTAEKQYYVEVEQSVLDALPEGSTIDPTDYILPVYAGVLKNRMGADELEAAFGTSNTSYILEIANVTYDVNTNTVSVKVLADTQEAAEKGMALITEKINALRDGVAQQINPHKLEVISDSVMSRVDNGLITTKNQIKTDIANYQKSLDTAIIGLNDLELEEEPEPPGNHIMKMAAIGFVLGTFLLAGLYAVAYLLDGRLHRGQELSEAYGVPIFGEFTRPRTKHPERAPDKWIEKWEQGKAAPDAVPVCEQIAELIKKEAATGSILLAGTGSEEKIAALAESLKAGLNGRSIRCQGNFLQSPGAVTKASEADHVLLVEEKDISRLKNIDRMAELLMTCKAKVIGAVIL